VRVLAWPDAHIPFDNQNSIFFLQSLISKYKINKIIQLGDIADFNSFSDKWPKDPNGYSPGQEYKFLRDRLEDYYKAFPEVEVIAGNHDLRPWKKLFRAELPIELALDISRFLGCPPGWKWHHNGLIVDGVKYLHGNKNSESKLIKCHERYRGSTVSGHLHSIACCIWRQDETRRYFTLSCGTLADQKKYAFRYSEENVDQFVLGAGIIIDGEFATFEPMPMNFL
jgi:hypothetical protein